MRRHIQSETSYGRLFVLGVKLPFITLKPAAALFSLISATSHTFDDHRTPPSRPPSARAFWFAPAASSAWGETGRILRIDLDPLYPSRARHRVHPHQCPSYGHPRNRDGEAALPSCRRHPAAIALFSNPEGKHPALPQAGSLLPGVTGNRPCFTVHLLPFGKYAFTTSGTTIEDMEMIARLGRSQSTDHIIQKQKTPSPAEFFVFGELICHELGHYGFQLGDFFPFLRFHGFILTCHKRLEVCLWSFKDFPFVTEDSLPSLELAPRPTMFSPLPKVPLMFTILFHRGDIRHHSQALALR